MHPRASESGRYGRFGIGVMATCLMAPAACGRPPAETARPEPPVVETEPPSAKLEDSTTEDRADPPKEPDGETTIGVDADDPAVNDNVWGDEVGEAYGTGGLGLAGTESTIGTRSSAPRIRAGSVTVLGRISQEAVMRTVRQNFGRFRFCYEKGLARNAALAGKVELKFAIERDGAVSHVVSGAGTDLPDPEVVGCVKNGLNGVSFPLPEGGPASVVYPILFEPPPSAAGQGTPAAHE